MCCAASSGPLATLAGVYQDVKGQRPEAVWREAVSLWTEWFGGVLPALLGNPQLRPLAQASLSTLSIAVDAVRHSLLPLLFFSSPELTVYVLHVRSDHLKQSVGIV